MYNIGYNFTIGDIVWIADYTSVIECEVTQVTLEVNPTQSNQTETNTYHLRPLSSNFDIILMLTDVVFPTLTDVVAYISDPELTSPNLGTHTINYTHTINDTVWVLDHYAILESKVMQITFDIDPLDHDKIERTLYRVLPTNGKYGILVREDADVYPSKLDAANYLKSTF